MVDSERSQGSEGSVCLRTRCSGMESGWAMIWESQEMGRGKCCKESLQMKTPMSSYSGYRERIYATPRTFFGKRVEEARYQSGESALHPCQSYYIIREVRGPELNIILSMISSLAWFSIRGCNSSSPKDLSFLSFANL